MFNCYTHLTLQHVAHKEYHHTGIQLVLQQMTPPARCCLAERTKDVKGRDNHNNQQDLDGKYQLGEVHIHAGWIIIATGHRNLGIFVGQDIDIVLECLAITAAITILR